MAETIYQAGDIQGYDFAFDAAGQIIDWSPVTREAQSHSVRLTLSLGMLFTTEGEVRESARMSVTIPRGADEITVKQRVYTQMREYIRAVARRVLGEPEGEGLEFEPTPPNTVALLSQVVLE